MSDNGYKVLEKFSLVVGIGALIVITVETSIWVTLAVFALLWANNISQAAWIIKAIKGVSDALGELIK